MSVNYFFGEWDAPATSPPAKQIPTPVGSVCVMCQEEIVEGDKGIDTSHLPDNMRYTHAECMFRSVVGSPAHLDDNCDVCQGGEPSNMTYREEALEVWRRVVIERHPY